MEALAWILGTPAVVLLVLWAASRARFTGNHSGGGLDGAFGVMDQLYQPAALEARIALEERKRQIIEAASGQDKDPATGDEDNNVEPECDPDPPGC